MNEVLTRAEFQTRFDSEWILVQDPEVNERIEVLGGKVLWHSKDRDEVYRKSIELSPQHAAYLYTGTMPENTAILVSLGYDPATVPDRVQVTTGSGIEFVPRFAVTAPHC